MTALLVQFNRALHKIHQLSLKYPLGQDTLTKLPPIEHEIVSDQDEIPFPVIPKELDSSFDRAFATYFLVREVIESDPFLEETLPKKGKKNIRFELLNLRRYEPNAVFSGDEYLSILQSPGSSIISFLLNAEPELLLTFLTANDWGIRSDDFNIRKGATVAFAMILKNIQSKFFNKEDKLTVDQEIKDSFLTLKILRQTLKDLKNDLNPIISNSAHYLDDTAIDITLLGIAKIIRNMKKSFLLLLENRKSDKELFEQNYKTLKEIQEMLKEFLGHRDKNVQEYAKLLSRAASNIFDEGMNIHIDLQTKRINSSQLKS